MQYAYLITCSKIVILSSLPHLLSSHQLNYSLLIQHNLLIYLYLRQILPFEKLSELPLLPLYPTITMKTSLLSFLALTASFISVHSSPTPNFVVSIQQRQSPDDLITIVTDLYATVQTQTAQISMNIPSTFIGFLFFIFIPLQSTC